MALFSMGLCCVWLFHRADNDKTRLKKFRVRMKDICCQKWNAGLQSLRWFVVSKAVQNMKRILILWTRIILEFLMYALERERISEINSNRKFLTVCTSSQLFLLMSAWLWIVCLCTCPVYWETNTAKYGSKDLVFSFSCTIAPTVSQYLGYLYIFIFLIPLARSV